MPDMNFAFYVEGIGLLLVGITGLVGNILGISFFYKKVVQASFHELMLSLAVFDSLYIIMGIFLFSLPSLYIKMWRYYWYAKMFTLLLPFCQIAITASTYLTLAMAVERYTTVCHPFFKFKARKHYIFPILLFSFLYNLPKFFELTVEGNQHFFKNASLSNLTDRETEFLLVPTEFRVNPNYVQVYLIILNLITQFLLPIISLTLLNISVYREVGRISKQFEQENSLRCPLHKKEIKLARVSVAIIAVFILCHGIRWIPNIWEFSHPESSDLMMWPTWVDYTTNISHLATIFNSSINFYIYLAKHGPRQRPTGSQPLLSMRMRDKSSLQLGLQQTELN